MAKRTLRTVIAFLAAGAAGFGVSLAGGSGWVIATASGSSGAIGAFVPSGSVAGLLRAERGVVPFIGRHEELTDLLAWCEDAQAAPVRLITGAGGVGESRLADRLMGRLAETGWLCSWVGEGREADALT